MFDNYAYVTPEILAQIVPTTSDHIFFNAQTNSAMGKDFPRACYMEIRGVVYGVNAHLFKWQDGTWNIGEEGKTEQLYMSWNESNKSISDAAKKTAAEQILSIVREWVAEHAAELAQAQRDHAERQLEKKRSQLNELRAQIEKAEQEIQAIETELNPPPPLRPAICPTCKAKNSLMWQSDAIDTREVLGIGETGIAQLGPGEYTTLDDTTDRIYCNECGAEDIQEEDMQTASIEEPRQVIK